LIRKLSNSGIGGNLLNWFESYLTDRRQRVTVLGVTSSTLPVTSGVPQGSILGPALFLLHVNDLPEADLSSRVAMFADDTKLFSAIKSQDDVASLQADLVNLEHWSSQSGLSFNKSKCKHQTITRKIVPFTSSYKLEDTKVTTTDCERDLGVWVSSNLTWKKQVCNQTSKANKSLGYIKRNTRFVKSTEARRMFYLALVRSHFGYATQIWAPQSIELINHLERTQRRATKYILNLPFSSDIDYKSRLQSLHLLPICYWHEYLDLIQSSGRTTRSNSSNTVKYVIPRCKTTSYQKSFLIRTSRIWNTLIDATDLHTDSLTVFKSCLLNYYFTSLTLLMIPKIREHLDLYA
jgi:hypothetical protein